MRKEAGAGVLAAMLAVTGPAVAQLTTPNPIVEKGVMLSQEGEIDLISKKEIETVNQRFSQFLAGEGEFEEAKINQKLMKSLSGKFRDLGYFSSNGENIFDIQAILLHCEDGENSQYLALGIKNSNGERKVVPVEWPIARMVKPGVELCRVYFRSVNNIKSDLDLVFFDNENKAKDYTRGLVGKRLLATFDYDDFTQSGLNEERLDLLSYFNSKNLINIGFAADLLFPEKKDLMEDDKDLLEKIKKTKTKSNPKSITSLDEMQQMIRNGDEFPVTFAFEYNLDEK